VVVVASKSEVALELLDIDVDADLLPLLLDHLAHGSERDERAPHRDHFEAQTSLAVRAQPIAVAVFLVKTEFVEQLVRLLEVVNGPLLVPLGPGTVDRVGRRRDRAPGPPTPSQNASFNWSRSMPSDSA